MKKVLVFIISICFLKIALAQTNESKDLSDYLQIAIENNSEIKSVKYSIDKTKLSVKETRANIYPHIKTQGKFENYFELPVLIVPGEIFGSPGENIAVEFGTNYNCELGATASQILYNQSYIVSLALSKEMLESQELNLDFKKQEIIYNISNIYYLTCITKRYKEVVCENTKRLDSLLVLTNNLYKNDLIRKLDVDQLTVQKSNLELEFDKLTTLLIYQNELLKYYIGLDKRETIFIDDSILFSHKLFSFPEFNVQKRFEYQLIENQKEIAQKNIKLAKSEYFPSLSAYAMYNYQAQSNEIDFLNGSSDKWFKIGLVGFSLDFPLFNGMSRNYKVQKAKIDLEVTKLKISETEEFLSIEYINAYNKYANALTKIETQQKNKDLSESIYKTYEDQYKESLISMQELLIAENELSKSELSYLNAFLGLKQAELDLLKATGNLENLLDPN